MAAVASPVPGDDSSKNKNGLKAELQVAEGKSNVTSSEDKENSMSKTPQSDPAGGKSADAKAAGLMAQHPTACVALSPDPNNFSIMHPLQHSWALWYDKNDKRGAQANYESHIQVINEFGTVEDFWRLFNNVVPPSKLAAGSDYALFKSGVKPMWEDPVNQKGGKWVIQLRSQKAKLDAMWLHALLSLIGEAFEHSDDVCGCVVSLRRSGDRLAIWTKTGHSDQIAKSIGRQMKEFLGFTQTISYSVHDDSIKKNSSFNVKNRFEV